MKSKKKKPTKNTGIWRQTLIGALVDFLVGLLLILIDRMLE